VKLTLEGVSYAATVTPDGTVLLPAMRAPLAPGTYTVRVEFAGDELYAPSSLDATLAVI
jgi:hypothetical protein